METTSLYFDREGVALYDIAFGWRRDREADFVERCVKGFGGEVPGTLLDIACGTGTFLKEMRGRGWRVAGNDASGHMLELAKKRLGPDVPLAQRSMTQFEAPDEFDVASCWLDSFTYLLTNDEITTHLKHVARALRKGGLYLVDLSFDSWAAEFWSGSSEDWRPAIDWGWSASCEDMVVYHDGCYGPPCDRVKHLATEYMYFRVKREGSDKQEERWYQAWKRVLHPQEFNALVLASGCFEPVEWFTGEFDLGETFGSSEGKGRALVLLKKTSS